MATNKYAPIEDYGIIGNLETTALVSIYGSIDFMSYTRFDSPTVFAAILDAEKGGRFYIHPEFDNVTYKQLYIPDSAALVTRFFADKGIAELTDFMPLSKGEGDCVIMRRISTIQGSIQYRMGCSPRFGYADVTHKAERSEHGISFLPDAENILPAHLLSDVPLEIKDGNGFASFTLEAGQVAYFLFEAGGGNHHKVSLSKAFETAYRDTVNYWQQWAEKSTYKGRWRETVTRSAITLKLLTSRRFGSVIAAPTFSLPESIGGSRNWDYRYTWVRDAAFTMYALIRLGFKDEATAFISWLKLQCLNKPMQLLYKLDGSSELPERTLDYMDGYKGSKPVRTGNKAHEQFQLDIYGELIDTVYLFNKYIGAITYEFWNEIAKNVEFVIAHWREPDHGIWEIRSERKNFLHSKMMCWVAMDRAIKIADDRSFPYPFVEWRAVRDEIFNEIHTNYWNEEIQSFVQHKGSKAVDASLLLMPLMRFISPVEKRWRTTLAAIERDLGADVLIYRYKNVLEKIDGLEGTEGTFTMCSFWYVECLAKTGHIEQAREYFEKMLGYTNHVGLFSEQLSVKGEHLGNYPQAFTHLALISAALELNKDLEKEVRPEGY
jgi:GH15 family glucan-1,4-alpha-glucosidase